MSTTVYVPLYKVSASYVVRQGRSWSVFEHLILWHLAQGRATSLDLAKSANVPVRLVIEAIIELMGAGWIDVHSGSPTIAFEATERGRAVAGSRDLPEDIRTLRRRTTLCMDRLTTSFFEPEDLVLVHEDNLPDSAALLKARTFKLNMTPTNSLDHLYMLEDETFQEWIEQRVTSQRFYAAVTVIGGVVSAGLPAYAPPALLDAISEEVASLEPSAATSAEDATVVDEPSERFYPAHIAPDDLIVGGPQHLQMVGDVLAQAKSFVLFHTCFVHPDAVTMLLPAIEAAARRGVVIDLLWGQRSNEMQEWSRIAFQKVQTLLQNVNAALRSKIRFSDRETGSHAKLIIADSGPVGALEAYVGSCNWLSSRYKMLEISLRLREPRLVADVATLLATLRMPTSGRWTPDVHRLVEIRNGLTREAVSGNVNANATVVIDRDHLRAIRYARDQAAARIISGCDLYGPAGETSVFVPMRTASNEGCKVTLFYNNMTSSMDVEGGRQTASELARKNIDLRQCDILHGKFLLWDDDTVLISSFNWLATTPSPWKPTGAEVGVLVRCPDLAKVLVEKLSSLRSEFGPLVAV